jgi:DUF917 family protein
MVTLYYDDIVDVIRGATLLGGGGGGSMVGGTKMLDGYADANGGKSEVKLSMCMPDEMEDGSSAAVTAGMGAPTKIPADFSPWALNAFKFYKYVQSFGNNDIQYSMAVEMGGFNTFVPMLVSLKEGIPFLDVDGAARAVPALTTLLLDVNGYDTLPIALADYIEGSDSFAKVLLDFPNNARNASMGEIAARDYLSSEMNQIAGLCGWMTKKEEFSPDRLPYGSITRAMKVGKIIRENPAEDVFDKLAEDVTPAIGFPGYTVVDGNSDAGGGFDGGFVLFHNESAGTYFRYDFQNENLVALYGSDPNSLKPVATVPDIICSFRVSDKTPLTNADYFDADGNVKKGMDVALGVVKVDDVWWHTGYDNVNRIWKEYMAHVKYDGDIIPFEKVRDNIGD